GVVQNIEGLEPELQIPPLGEFEVFQRGKIDAKNSRPGNRVTAEIAVVAQGLQSHGLDIEPFRRPALAGIQAQGGARHSVRAVVAMAGIGPVRAGSDVQRKAGGDCPDGVQLPAAYDAAGETVIEVLAAFAYGKIIEHRGDKAMARVKDRQAALAAHARPVLGLKLIAAEDADA